MRKIARVRTGLILAVSAVVLLFVPGARAQKSPNADTPPAPVPAQISSAKKIFISNAGSDCSPFGDTAYSGGPDRAYDQFYAAMKISGRYQLVGAPADAELVFEIRFTCPAYVTPKSSTYDPQLGLLIRDVSTRFILWSFTEHLEGALLQGNRDKNFNKAMSGLVADVIQISAGSSPPASGL